MKLQITGDRKQRSYKIVRLEIKEVEYNIPPNWYFIIDTSILYIILVCYFEKYNNLLNVLNKKTSLEQKLLFFFLFLRKILHIIEFSPPRNPPTFLPKFFHRQEDLRVFHYES